MKRAALLVVGASLVAALLNAEDRKGPPAVPERAARPAAPVANAEPTTKAEPSKPAADDAPVAAPAPGKDKEIARPLSLAYIPRDAIAVAAIRPPALLKCPALVPFTKRIDKTFELQKALGFRVERIEQISLVFMLVDGPAFKKFKLPAGTPGVMGMGGQATQPEPVVAIFHLSDPDDAVTLAAAIHRDGDEQNYAGRTYTRTKQEGSNTCVLVDGRIVVVAEEPYLRRSIVAGPGGASQAKWARAWRLAPPTDVLMLANVAVIRSLMALKLKEMGGDAVPKLTINPPSAAALLDARAALLAVKVDDAISARLQLIAEEDTADTDISRNRNALKAALDLHQASLSSLREEASGEAGEKSAALLASLDILDSALDSVTIEIKERIVEASLTISLDDAEKALLTWISSLDDDEDDGEAVREGDDTPAPVPVDAAEEGDPNSERRK